MSQTDRSATYPHNDWEAMYAIDLLNFSNSAVGDNAARVLGGELTAWGDAAATDSQNVWQVITPNIFAVAEAWWSPRSVTRAPPSSAQPRMDLHRCRVAERGVPTNAVFGSGAAYEAFGGQCPYAEWSFSPLPL